MRSLFFEFFFYNAYLVVIASSAKYAFCVICVPVDSSSGTWKYAKKKKKNAERRMWELDGRRVGDGGNRGCYEEESKIMEEQSENETENRNRSWNGSRIARFGSKFRIKNNDDARSYSVISGGLYYFRCVIATVKRIY